MCNFLSAIIMKNGDILLCRPDLSERIKPMPAKQANARIFPEGKGTTTPWGKAQTSTVLARGVVLYTTASHGGLAVTQRWADINLSPAAEGLALRWGGKLWFEEDCQVALVFHEHPELFEYLLAYRPPADHWEKMIRQYYPAYFTDTFPG